MKKNLLYKSHYSPKMSLNNLNNHKSIHKIHLNHMVTISVHSIVDNLKTNIFAKNISNSVNKHY